MPHYKDGTCAVVGDVVKGSGYNINDRDGNPKTIVGTVVGLTLAESCNIRVAFLAVKEVPLLAMPVTYGMHYGEGGRKYELSPVVEYGEAKAFELVEPVLVRAFVEAEEVLLRPRTLGNSISQLCKAPANYQLFRERNGEVVPLGYGEVDVEHGDRFYCVPPCTGA